MSRRRLLPVLLLAACGQAPALDSAPSGPVPPASAPNVLLVVLDTTRGDRCSVNGYPRPTTPTLERLARDGVTFRNAWSPSPWTAPAHASLFTGLRPENHGLHVDNSFFLEERHATLATRFRERGYRTGCFTANDFIAPEFGLTQGFEHVDRVYERDASSEPPSAYAHREALRFALQAKADGKPFFVFVNDLEPHAPYEPMEHQLRRFLPDATPEEVEAAKAVKFPVTAGISAGVIPIDSRTLGHVSDLYDAEIATVDETLARLVRGLEANELLDDTIVVVTADHGENLGDHGLMEHQFSVHRSLLHVPLVIRFPSSFDGGRVVDDVVRLEDVAATLTELCGVPVQGPLDGQPLTRDVSGRVARALLGISHKALESTLANHPCADVTRFGVSWRSVVDGRYHLVRSSDGREELYDVVTDPLEMRDLSVEAAHVARRLRSLLVSP